MVQGKIKAPAVWVCYCRCNVIGSDNKQKKKKGKNRIKPRNGLFLKMYKTPQSEEQTTELDDDDQLVTRKEKIQFSPEDREIIAADVKFNLNF